MHPILAIRAFFAVLFGKSIPMEAIFATAEPKKLDAGERPEPVAPPEETPAPESKPEPKPSGPAPESIAVSALAVLQSEGRLLDFLSENIDDYADEDIGAAVREVHRGCKKAVENHFKLVPVRTEEEEEMVTVPEGYDPSEIRLVGNVVGKPPFSGTLKHRGWRASEVRLPKVAPGDASLVVTPAEVEV